VIAPVLLIMPAARGDGQSVQIVRVSSTVGPVAYHHARRSFGDLLNDFHNAGLFGGFHRRGLGATATAAGMQSRQPDSSRTIVTRCNNLL
jgi:hypothetical protein